MFYLHHNCTSFVDRDSLMRFHHGLGVGHVYSHRAGILESPFSAPQPVTQPAVQVEDEHVESEPSFTNTRWPQHPIDDEGEDDDDDSHVGVEELIPFEQGQNGSTETLIEALGEMYGADHVFDYEN
jgi:hypothetical protein